MPVQYIERVAKSIVHDYRDEKTITGQIFTHKLTTGEDDIELNIILKIKRNYIFGNIFSSLGLAYKALSFATVLEKR